MANALVLQVSDDSFANDVLASDIPVVVDFWAPWCGPCKAIAPLLDQLAEQYDGKVRVAKVNVDNNPQVAAQYGITGIPAFITFQGGEVVDRLQGAQARKLGAMFSNLA